MKRAIVLLLLAAAACNSGSGPGICITADCLTAQPDGGPACHKDSDCNLGRICASDHCTPGCRSTRDCPASTICDPAHGPYGACVSSTPAIDASVVDARPGTPDAAPPPPPDAATGADGCAYMQIPVLADGSFDLGSNSWTAAGNASITFFGSATPRSAPFMGKLGGTVTTDSLTQSVTFPADALGATLSGYYWIVTNEPGGAAAKDILNFEQQELLGWTWFGQRSNQDASGGWVPFSIPLNTPIFGGLQFVSGISAVVTNDATNPTTVYLDDLSLTVTVCR